MHRPVLTSSIQLGPQPELENSATLRPNEACRHEAHWFMALDDARRRSKSTLVMSKDPITCEVIRDLHGLFGWSLFAVVLVHLGAALFHIRI